MTKREGNNRDLNNYRIALLQEIILWTLLENMTKIILRGNKDIFIVILCNYNENVIKNKHAIMMPCIFPL